MLRQRGRESSGSAKGAGRRVSCGTSLGLGTRGGLPSPSHRGEGDGSPIVSSGCETWCETSGRSVGLDVGVRLPSPFAMAVQRWRGTGVFGWLHRAGRRASCCASLAFGVAGGLPSPLLSPGIGVFQSASFSSGRSRKYLGTDRSIAASSACASLMGSSTSWEPTKHTATR